MDSEFSEEEQATLKPFVTNLEKPVFGLRNMPEVVMGALFSRYSRTTKSLRRVLLDEFILDKQSGFAEISSFSEKGGVDQIVATRKAEEFYDRVLVGYGDDSVAELGGAHIACEEVSNIASKVLEDARIGISPLEKSTRYVYFNQKVAGKYKYYRGEELLAMKAADNYISACDFLFDTYSSLLERMTKFEMERFPKDAEVSDRAYQSTIRAKVCDVLRGLLPASALTNVGLYGNGRAFEYLLLKMYAHGMREMNGLAREMQAELDKLIPSFVKRADDSYGKAGQQYLRETREGMKKLAEEMLVGEGGLLGAKGGKKGGEAGEAGKMEGKVVAGLSVDNGDEVTLVDFDGDAEEKIIAAMLYPHSDLSLGEIRERAKAMDAERRDAVIAEYLGRRQNRRHKAGRALENAYYGFDLLANFGQYRDLQRHRVLTQERQLLGCRQGYDLPKGLEEASFAAEFQEAMEKAREAWELMARESPEYAQYAVPLAYKLRWYARMNLREAYHLAELRSMQQGHPDYRRVAQKIHSEVKRVHPRLAAYMKFVDMKEYGLERLEAEKKLDRKMGEMKRKYG